MPATPRDHGMLDVGDGQYIIGKSQARQETGATWNMKRQKLSNRGTTRRDELAMTKGQ